MLSAEQHRELARWACDCAERVLPLFEAQSSDPRPRETLAGCRRWVRGEEKMAEVRRLAFAAHAAARETDGAAQAAARACGQAAGVAHVPTHAPHAAAYARKAVSLAGGDEAAELEWQKSRLRDDLYEFVFGKAAA